MLDWTEKSLGVFELNISGIIRAKIVDRAFSDHCWFGSNEHR